MKGFSFSRYRQRRAVRAAASLAYEGLMKAALSPELYVQGTVTDTFEGRAQMVTLHTALALHRLATAENGPAGPMAEALNARVLDGFDAAFREKGVGDSSIARKVRALAGEHYGLGRSIIAGISFSDGDALQDTLIRNGVCEKEGAPILSAYLLDMSRKFAAQTDEQILTGLFPWSSDA